MSMQSKRLELELLKVRAAKLETEIRISERLEEIKKIEETLRIQSDREAELTKQLEELKSKE